MSHRLEAVFRALDAKEWILPRASRRKTSGSRNPRPPTSTTVRQEVYVVLNYTIVTCYHSNGKLVHLDLVREKPVPAGLKSWTILQPAEQNLSLG